MNDRVYSELVDRGFASDIALYLIRVHYRVAYNKVMRGSRRVTLNEVVGMMLERERKFLGMVDGDDFPDSYLLDQES